MNQLSRSLSTLNSSPQSINKNISSAMLSRFAMNLRQHIFPLLRLTRISHSCCFRSGNRCCCYWACCLSNIPLFQGQDIFGSTQVKTRPHFSGWRLFMQTHVAVFAHDRRLLLARRRKWRKSRRTALYLFLERFKERSRCIVRIPKWMIWQNIVEIVEIVS